MVYCLIICFINMYMKMKNKNVKIKSVKKNNVYNKNVNKKIVKDYNNKINHFNMIIKN